MFLSSFRKPGVRERSEVPVCFSRNTLDNLDFVTVFPSTATRAIALASDPSVSLQDYAEFIITDTAVVSAVLKLANSPTYQRGRPTANLTEAVIRLGLRGCSALVIGIGMCGLFRETDPETVHLCELLWKHSFFTATLCSELNTSLRLGFGGEEFTGGLLHDLGRFLMAVAIPKVFSAVDPLDFVERGTIVLDRESEVLGTDHCELGERFCEDQKLPTVVSNCVRYHHDPTGAQGAPKLVALIAFADDLSNHILSNHNLQGYALTDSNAFLLLEQACSERGHPLVPDLKSVVLRAIKKTREFLKTIPAA